MARYPESRESFPTVGVGLWRGHACIDARVSRHLTGTWLFFFLLFYSFLSFFFLHGKTKGIDLGAVVAYSRLDIIDEEYV